MPGIHFASGVREYAEIEARNLIRRSAGWHVHNSSCRLVVIELVDTDIALADPAVQFFYCLQTERHAKHWNQLEVCASLLHPHANLDNNKFEWHHSQRMRTA